MISLYDLPAWAVVIGIVAFAASIAVIAVNIRD